MTLVNTNKNQLLLTALESGDFKTALLLVSQEKLNLPNKCTPLHYACQHGRIDVTEELITNFKCSIESKDENGCTPLHITAQYGQIHALKYMLHLLFTEDVSSLSIKIDSKLSHALMSMYKQRLTDRHTDLNSHTPLHAASIHGHLNIVQFLVCEIGCDSVSTNSEGQSCLHLAAQHGHLPVMRYLLEEVGCDMSLVDEHGRTPTYLAAGGGHLDAVKYMIEDKGAYPYFKTTREWKTHCFTFAPGRSLVHTASYEGHLAIIRYLVDHHGCDPSSRDDNGITPLHLACQQGHKDIVVYLISDLQCDPNCTTIDGKTCLHVASVSGRLDIIKFLINNSHCEIKPNAQGDTPLHTAAYSGKLNVVKFFIKDLNCEASIRGQFERIPLHHASENGHLDVVQYLVDRQHCDPLCSDKDKVTPLHQASANGHLKVVEYFTTVHHCNPLVKNIYNNTPLHDAALNGKLDVVKFFVEELHCDPNVKGYLGCLPLFCACLNGHFYVVKFLTEDHQPPTSLLNTPAFYAASLVNHPDILQQLVHTSSSLDEYNIWGMSMAASLIGKHHSASVIKFVSDQPVRIFVMGNSGSGKTTLVKSLTNKSFLGWFQQVKGVAPFTAGIVPTIEENSDLGAVKIYDFAGHEHYYASHEMILQQAMHPLTLIAVDTSLPLPEIQKQLVYWLSVLSNASEHVHTVIIGSHSDQINSDKQKEIEKLVISEAKHKCYSNISNHRLVFFDCRYSFSYGMIILRFFLYSFCRSVRLNSIRTKSKSSQDCEHFLDFLKHIRVKMISITELNTRLQGFFKTQPPNLMDKKRKIQIEALKLLVNNEERILHCCKTLSMNGFFLLLPHNEDKSKSLLILDEKAVLSELHSCLERLKKNTDNGMFEEFELKEILSCLLSNQMDPDLAIKYLILTQFCTKVSSEQLMNVPSTSSTLGRVTYYFFPNLVNAKRPVVLWNTAEENYTHLYTWCLECTSTHQFFTPRYIHTLFIQLIQCESVINHAEFTIWEKGILLVHSNGSRCVIEVKDQSNELYLAMQCMKGCEMYLVEQRSMLISLIKSLMRKVCSILQPEEYLLDPECSYPPNKYTKIPISRITALSVIAGYPTVPCKVDDGSIHQFSVSDLLFFDSLHVIEESILHHILVNRKSKKYVPFATVKNVVKAVEGCKQLVKVLQNQVNITYSELYRALLKYTVFTDGQLYELAGKPLIDDSIQEMAHSRKLHLGPLKLEDLYDINVELTSIVDNWKDFGLALGLNSTTLQMIESKYYNRGVERCLTEVLVAWLKGQNITYDSSSITWEHLIDALKSLSMKECVDQVEQKLSGECAVSSRNNFSSVDDTKLGTESLSDVLNNVKDLTYKWFHFGLSLGLDYPTLMEIEASQHYEVKDLMITMLNKWLKDKGNRPSWRSLAIALNCPLVQEHRVAETIENEHKVTENSV